VHNKFERRFRFNKFDDYLSLTKNQVMATKKAKAKKAPAKKAVKKAAKAAKPKVKRKPNPAFMKPMTPSAALAAVVGSKPLPRTEVTKKVWDYIKKNKLQDAKERRNINGDANLQKVFGGKKTVSMFEMAKHINNNLS
jgi:chromatin remodeling complex protein RSC6